MGSAFLQYKGHSTVFLVAEDHTRWDAVTRSPAAGGPGFDVTWYAELEHARSIIVRYEAALAEGRGAIVVDGQLVDIPFYAYAKRLLARWQPEASPTA